MFNIGDRVRHKQNGTIGKVIGYGYQIVESYYLTTIEVQILDRIDIKSSVSRLKQAVIEDLFSEWILCTESKNSQSSNLLLNT